MSLPIKSFALMVALALVAGCGSGSGDTTPPVDPDPPVGDAPDPVSKRVDRAAIVPGAFADCDAYLAYLAEAFFTSVTQDQPCGFGWCPVDILAIGAPPPPAPATPLPEGDAFGIPGGVSQTNTQESGIDEGDIVEADAAGNLYILSGRRLVVADGFPADQTSVIAELDLTFDFDSYAYPLEMLLDETNQRLVVFGSAYVVDPEPGRLVTLVWLVDVSNPAAPVVDGTMQFDGRLLASRRDGGRVHAFSYASLSLPSDFYAAGGWELIQQYYTAVAADDDATVAATAAELRERVAAAIDQRADSYVPQVTSSSGGNNMLACTDLAAPGVRVEPALSMIVSFDTDGTDLGSTALVNNVGNVYVAPENAYLVQSSWGWWWDADQADETAIYKFAIGDGAPEYLAAGVVVGQVRNSLYLSEHEGFLRVATNQTVYETSTGQFGLENHLHVLADDGAGTLDVTGSVENFVSDEDIFAVRFAGETGYVVTFRRIDPLFTFDLSDPLSPRVAGELELPGFSTYMQPIDDGYLLTIGRDGDEAGNIGPLALRIFDVTDLASPRLAHTYVLEDSDLGWAGWSPASFDYRAFNYYAPAGLLSLPYSFFEFDWQDSFNGFVYFDVDVTGGIFEIGRVNHNDLVGPALCTDPDNCDYFSLWYTAEPQRSVIMTDGPQSYIHTVSNVGVKVTPADDPANVLASFVLPLAY